MRNPLAAILTVLLLGFSVESGFAGPFDRFRERLRQLRGEAAPAPVVAPTPAPVAPPAPQDQVYDINPNLTDTIWTGVMTISAGSIDQYQGGKKQQYTISNPKLSAPVELWHVSNSEWLLVLDITQLKGGNNTSGLIDGDCNDWEELIGTAPEGTTSSIYVPTVPRYGVLEGYDGESSINKNARTFMGSRDRNTNPERMVSVAGSYQFMNLVNDSTDSESDPTMRVDGTVRVANQNQDGLRVNETIQVRGDLRKAKDRSVTRDKNKRGGFRDYDWWGWEPGVENVIEQGQQPPI